MKASTFLEKFYDILYSEDFSDTKKLSLLAELDLERWRESRLTLENL